MLLPLLVLACAPPPEPHPGPTARERFAAEPSRVEVDTGSTRNAGWPAIGTAPVRDGEARVVPLERGRWVTWSRSEQAWILWDPARGEVRRVSAAQLRPPRPDLPRHPHGEARRGWEDRGLPTPDGAWVVGPDHAARLDPDVEVKGRVQHVGGFALAWGPEAGARFAVPPPGSRSGDGALATRLKAPAEAAKPAPAGEELELVRVGLDRPIAELPGCLSPEIVWWSADSARLACLTPAGLSAFDADGREVAAWDAEERGFRPSSASLSRDGRVMALVEADGRIAGWHLDQDTAWTVLLPAGVAAAVSEDGSLVVASDGAGLAVIDAADGTKLTPDAPVPNATRRRGTYRAGPEQPAVAPSAPSPPPPAVDASWELFEPTIPVYRVRWEGDVVVAGNDDHDLRVAPDGTATLAPPTQVAPPTLPPDIGADDVQVWFPRTDGAPVRLPIPKVVALAATPRHLALVSGVVGVVVVDRATGEFLHTLRTAAAPRARTVSLAFSDDGARLAYASIELRAWAVEPGTELLGPLPGDIVALATKGDGSAIAAATSSGALARIDMADPTPRTIANHLDPGSELRFQGDVVVVTANGSGASIDPGGDAMRWGAPWQNDQRGLSLDDAGRVRVLWSGSAYEVRADGQITRVGPEVEAAEWRLGLSAMPRWLWPGRAGVPSGAPVCFNGVGQGCSTVPASPPPSGARGEGATWVAPSPTGEWQLARIGQETAAVGPDGEQGRAPGRLEVAWASSSLAVVSGDGVVGTWEMGSQPVLVPASSAKAMLTAAGGERQARLGPALLVGPRGTDRVDCVLPGGHGPPVLSPNGRYVAWFGPSGQPWLADVDACEILQRPLERRAASQERRTTVQAGWLTSWRGERLRLEGAEGLVGESPDHRLALTRGPRGSTQATLWQLEPVEVLGTFAFAGLRSGASPRVAVDPGGVVAWIGRAGVLTWWAPDDGLREAAWLGPIEEVVAHPGGGLVVAARGVVSVVTPATLAGRSVPAAP